jgi:hypothetical protein
MYLLLIMGLRWRWACGDGWLWIIIWVIAITILILVSAHGIWIGTVPPAGFSLLPLETLGGSSGNSMGSSSVLVST